MERDRAREKKIAGPRVPSLLFGWPLLHQSLKDQAPDLDPFID